MQQPNEVILKSPEFLIKPKCVSQLSFIIAFSSRFCCCRFCVESAEYLASVTAQNNFSDFLWGDKHKNSDFMQCLALPSHMPWTWCNYKLNEGIFPAKSSFIKWTPLLRATADAFNPKKKTFWLLSTISQRVHRRGFIMWVRKWTI